MQEPPDQGRDEAAAPRRVDPPSRPPARGSAAFGEPAAQDWIARRRTDPRGGSTLEPRADRVVAPPPTWRSRTEFGAEGAPHLWRNVALALGLLLSVLVGVTGSLAYSALTRGPAGSAAASQMAVVPSSSVRVTATPVATPSPADSASPGGTGLETASPSPTATTTAIPESTGPIWAASVTFHSLALDSAADAGGTARTFQFTSDGAGSVSAQVVASTPSASIKMCIQANEAAVNCAAAATPGFFTVAPSGAHAQWTVTLVATDPGSAPAVDVTISWRTRTPAMTLAHGRFQGSPNADSVRGFRVTLKTHAAGALTLSAAWPPVTTDAALTLRDVTLSSGTTVDQANYMAVGAISTPYSHPVEAGKTYEVTLYNAETDSGRPDLTATIAFP